MATFDIKQRSFEYSIEIVQFVRSIPFERGVQPLLDQLVRCGTSIGANIHEGFSGSSKRDFINYYNIALKSANETSYWLRLIGKAIPRTSAEANRLDSETLELAKILAKIIINSKTVTNIT